ncbi:MAG: T9SS type A sorting domain-containing protein [Saprospiraceae bacterium]|nr:T9SS type A sorting domain-containing protein [Saprospiraceae bacterium]
MKTTIFILAIIIFNNAESNSQKYDFKWLMGYSFADNPYDTGWGCAIMDFDTPDGNPIFYEEKYKRIDFLASGANICDINGNYLFACNGGYVEGPNDSLMLNGDDLGNDIKYPELGVVGSQNTLILPDLENSNSYILFNKIFYYFENYGLSIKSLEHSIVDMKRNKNNGELISRRNLTLSDTLDSASLIATKHANGKDWWIIISEDTKVGYYIFFLSGRVVKLHNYFNFKIKKSRGESGQTFFSQCGNYIATAAGDGLLNRYNLFFMKFNRCSGEIEYFQKKFVPFQKITWDAGCSFSPDSKYLYYATLDTLYQFPILGDSLGNIRVSGIYDGFIELTSGGFTTSTQFGPMQTAPDGKIYFQTTYPTRSLHVIHNPDRDHFNCNFRQHDIYSPTLRICLPNFPNYRLGPIDGSICDTLGIDNIPWCHWRYNQDSTDFLNFYFTDLSAYEVEEWYWDFGDPASPDNKSREVNPIHRFSATGVYDVCLIVKNKNGADTLCRTVRIGVVGNKDETRQIIDIQSWPNPFSEFMVINILDYNPQDMYIEISDLNGKSIYHSKARQGSHWITTENWPSGVYFVRIFERGELIHTEKMIRKSGG